MTSAFGSGNPPTGLQSTELARLRAAGIQGDHSQIADLIKNLNAPPHRAYLQTDLHALGQLGAVDALPTVEALTQDKDAEIASLAKVARARILAESNAGQANNSQQQAAYKVRIFLQELGLSPASLNNGLANYVAAQAQSGNNIKTTPLEVHAVRELADIIYRGSYPDFATIPEVSQVNFSLDYPAMLKMRLASLPQADRVNTMIQELAHKKQLTTNDDYEIQLLSNEGISASRRIVALLQDLDAHRQRISAGKNLITYTGISALVAVLRAIGDQSQASALTDLRLHPQGIPALCSETDLYYIKNGIKRPRVYGY